MPSKPLHGWCRLKCVVAIQLVLITSTLMSVVNAEQITYTVHSTHAYVNLAPGSCCAGTVFGGCGRRYDAWTMTTYTSSDGMKHTFHQAQSAGNDLNHRDSTRHMSIPFKGTSLYVYMAPRRFLHHPPGNQEICIYGTCQSVNVIGRYEAAGDSDEPVLMWWAENLDQDQDTLLELRLVDNSGGGNTRSMSFQYLQYTQDIQYSIRPSLTEGLRLVNATLHDTNYAVDYAPLTSHSGRGEYNPWDKRLFSSPSSTPDTFHHTSNWGNEPSGDRIRQVSFNFQGAAIYLYGPPPLALKEIWGDGLVHGRQEVCLNDQCGGLDVHQTYLNIPFSKRNDPVLLWSFELFSLDPYSHSTFDSFTLDHSIRCRIRFLDPDSPVRGSHMTLDRAIVSEVHTLPRWYHPLPNGRYSSTTVGFGSVMYTPDATAWSGFAVGMSNVSMQAYDVLSEDVMPGWWHMFRGHDIKVYGTPRIYMGNLEHATQMICVDTECHYVDVEQVYLAIDMWDYWRPVLLLHLSDLDPFITHTISAVAVRKDWDTAKPRVMTFRSLEYETFTPVTPVVPSPERPWPDFSGVLKVFRNIIVAILCVPVALVAGSSLIIVGFAIAMAIIGALWKVAEILFVLVLILAHGVSAVLRRFRSEDSEISPLIPGGTPWRPPTPTPRPTHYTPSAPPFPSPPPPFTYILIPQPPPPYVSSTDDDGWVRGTPETTSAAPPPYVPMFHPEEPTIAPTPPRIPLEGVLGRIRAQQTVQATTARDRRPDPPSCSPNPAFIQSWRTTLAIDNTFSHREITPAAQQRPFRGVVPPAQPSARGYGAIYQHLPQQLSPDVPPPLPQRPRHRESRPREPVGYTNGGWSRPAQANPVQGHQEAGHPTQPSRATGVADTQRSPIAIATRQSALSAHFSTRAAGTNSGGLSRPARNPPRTPNEATPETRARWVTRAAHGRGADHRPADVRADGSDRATVVIREWLDRMGSTPGSSRQTGSGSGSLVEGHGDSRASRLRSVTRLS